MPFERFSVSVIVCNVHSTSRICEMCMQYCVILLTALVHNITILLFFLNTVLVLSVINYIFERQFLVYISIVLGVTAMTTAAIRKTG